MAVDEQGFWEQVEVGGEDECWQWTGKTVNGYGYAILRADTARRLGLAKPQRSHRLALILAGARKPPGADVAERDAAVDQARYAELDARDACGFRETDPDRLTALDAAQAESARVQRAWRHDLHAMIAAGEYGRSEIVYHRRRCGCERYDRTIKGAPLRG